jgi:hypothetical protein
VRVASNLGTSTVNCVSALFFKYMELYCEVVLVVDKRKIITWLSHRLDTHTLSLLHLLLWAISIVMHGYYLGPVRLGRRALCVRACMCVCTNSKGPHGIWLFSGTKFLWQSRDRANKSHQFTFDPSFLDGEKVCACTLKI